MQRMQLSAYSAEISDSPVHHLIGHSAVTNSLSLATHHQHTCYQSGRRATTRLALTCAPLPLLLTALHREVNAHDCQECPTITE